MQKSLLVYTKQVGIFLICVNFNLIKITIHAKLTGLLFHINNDFTTRLILTFWNCKRHLYYKFLN